MAEPQRKKKVTGGVRRLSSRWAIEATLEAIEPIHLGAGEDGTYVDMALLRDRATGKPLLPGSSVAGALRDHLRERIAGDRTPESASAACDVSTLFGGRFGDPDGNQSAIIIRDAFGEHGSVEVRDHVRLNPHTGTVKGEDGGKFDMEAWAPGTSFRLQLELAVPESWGASREVEMLAMLSAALDGVTQGDVLLGAKTNRGFGRCKISGVSAVRHKLANDPAGWKAYLATGLAGAAQAANGTRPSLVEAAKAACPDLAVAASTFTKEYPSRRVVVSVDVESSGGILMAGAESGIADADRRHIHSKGKPVVTGTGLTGALRQRARRIAAQVRSADAPALVEMLFGTDAKAKTRLSASRVRSDEVEIGGSNELQVTRIKIDRFTQAPVDSALLQEEPVYRGHSTLRFRLRLPRDEGNAGAIMGLFMLTLKDLLLGDVAVGGTVGVGRGVFRPKNGGQMSITRGSSELVWPYAEAPAEDFRKLVEGWVEGLHAAPPAGNGEVHHG